jgi:ubiquinone/menaquinone biosynthesis C-methylase UbiE
MERTMPGMSAEEWKRRVTSHWDRAAAPWDRWFDWYTVALQPLAEWSCAAAGVTAGSRVLDVACGTGEPALTAARRAGPDGFVLATDIAPGMVAAAARRAEAAGLANLRFEVMDAEALDLPDESFDACTCVCGLMFCTEPARAVAGIRRALRPGGRFAISVWDHPRHNDFALVFGSAVAEVFGVPLPTAGEPGPFRLADSDTLAAVLRAGGISAFDMESRPMTFRYDSFKHYLAITTDFACGLKPRFDALSQGEQERFEEMVRQLLEPHIEGGFVRLQATPLCVSGALPA